MGIAYLLFFFSGCAGLGCQIVWSRMLTTGLGHEMPSVMAVVVAFMLGMAGGSWLLDKKLRETQAPGQWYGGLEIAAGLWGLLLILLIPFANDLALRWIGPVPSPARHWTVAFSLPAAVLLPATMAMGATFPAMQRFVFSVAPARGPHIGGLYAANTLGAVTGILGTVYLVLPAVGFRNSLLAFAALNLACGAAAFWLARRPAATAPCEDTSLSRVPLRIRASLLLSGFLGIGLELAGIRVLSQVLENTVFTFAAALGAYLLGTSLGAGLHQKFGSRFQPSSLLNAVWLLLALSVLGSIFALAQSQELYNGCRAQFGDSRAGVLLAEMAVAGSVFFLPALLLGVSFSHLVEMGRAACGSIGKLAALNLLGGAFAGFVFNLLLLPRLGSKWTFVLISALFLALLCQRSAASLIGAGLWAALALLLPPHLQIVQTPPGGRLLDYREGVMASVAVVEDAAGQRALRVNNRFQMGGTGVADAEYRHAHIPLLLHPAPRRALFLGLGTGITLGGASLHPELQSDGVELLPEVAAAMGFFAPHNFSPPSNPKLRVITADARRFVRSSSERYDVIVADLFHPARDGAGFLYTTEHFAALRQRLAPQGLVCQWLPLHQLDESMLRVVVRSFLEVFPHAQAWLLRFNVEAPVMGLVARVEDTEYAANWLDDRLKDPSLAAALKKLSLGDSLRLFGHLAADSAQLRDFSRAAPLNTDDHPRVLFEAPDFVYRKKAYPFGGLEALLKAGTTNLASALLLAQADRAEFGVRLDRYAAARNIYLAGLMREMRGEIEPALDAYIESARASADFTSGYAECLSIAAALAPRQPEQARRLLERLAEAQPSRGAAQEMAKRLFPE